MPVGRILVASAAGGPDSRVNRRRVPRSCDIHSVHIPHRHQPLPPQQIMLASLWSPPLHSRSIRFRMVPIAIAATPSVGA